MLQRQAQYCMDIDQQQHAERVAKLAKKREGTGGWVHLKQEDTVGLVVAKKGKKEKEDEEEWTETTLKQRPKAQGRKRGRPGASKASSAKPCPRLSTIISTPRPKVCTVLDAHTMLQRVEGASSKAEYINDRVALVDGKCVIDVLGLFVPNRKGGLAQYRRADLNYDIRGGFLRQMPTVACQSVAVDASTPVPTPSLLLTSVCYRPPASGPSCTACADVERLPSP
jgi:hypothetical protein